MKGLSKFVTGRFFGGYDEYAVNAQKFSESAAIFTAEDEEGIVIGEEPGRYTMSKAFVKWRAGIDNDGDKCVGWWLEYTKRKKGSCPVYAFHKNGGIKDKEYREKLCKEPEGWSEGAIK